jgi:tetratricopeptide (TPR) repeat protein
MDAVRKLDEWTEVTSADRTADPIPRLAVTSDTRAAALALEPLHWRVLAEVDGYRTLRQIARMIGRAELDVARAIHSLVASQVVEIDDSPELVTASIAGEIQAASDALKDGDAEGARRRLRALLDSSPDSAEIHTLLGTAEARLGRLNEGVACFDRAVELDPLYEPAYFHSAVTLVRQGKLDRAHDVLTTFFRLANPGNALYARGKVLMVELSRTLEALKGSE